MLVMFIKVLLEYLIQVQGFSLMDIIKISLQKVFNNVGKLSWLIEELFEFFRLEVKKVELKEVFMFFIVFCWQLFVAYEFGVYLKNIEYWLEYELQEEAFYLIDCNCFEKIINNFLFNVLKFIFKNGMIMMWS